MSDVIIAGTKPVVTKLKPGQYWWCACGRSSNQPYCDGSHEGTGIQPLEVTIETEKRYALCTCKQTAKAPWCDGTHKKLT